MANVAALSGLTVAWRRVFRAAGQDCPADAGGRGFEQCILLRIQPSETIRGSQEIEFSRRQELGAKGP